MRIELELGLASLVREPVDLLTINALRWEMVGEKYDAYRGTEALRLSPESRAAIDAHLARGRALLGLHTATICFSDWPQWWISQELFGESGSKCISPLPKFDVSKYF